MPDADRPWTLRPGVTRVGDRVLPQWQHEITASGRVFYCPDAAERIIWVTRVDLGHPRETD